MITGYGILMAAIGGGFMAGAMSKQSKLRRKMGIKTVRQMTPRERKIAIELYPKDCYSQLFHVLLSLFYIFIVAPLA